MKKEESIHKQVCNYLRLQYPKVKFRTDFAAGCKMTVGQAVKHKSLQSCKGWPDLFIAKPNRTSAGLFLELKKDGTRLTKKDGSWADEHLREQAETMRDLTADGYECHFAVGFDQAIELIDKYLKQ